MSLSDSLDDEEFFSRILIIVRSGWCWKAILDYTIPRLQLARCIREKVDLLKTHQEILKALEQTDKKCDNKKMIERINYEKRVSFYSFGLCLVSRFSL